MLLDPNQLEAIKKFLPESTTEYLLNPLAEDVGLAISGLFYGIFGKLVHYGAVKKADTDALIKETVQKMQKVPKEHLTDVNKGLIFKYFEDSRYSLSSTQLRHYYSTLIANSTDDRNTDEVSPYFSTILGNMTVSDALLLKKFRENVPTSQLKDYLGARYYVNYSLPIYKIILKGPHGEIATTSEDMTFTDRKKNKVKSYTSQINVLSSFQVLSTQYELKNQSVNDDYEMLKKLSDYKEQEKSVHGESSKYYQLSNVYNKAIFDPGVLKLTVMGKTFARMVLIDPLEKP